MGFELEIFGLRKFDSPIGRKTNELELKEKVKNWLHLIGPKTVESGV